MVYLKRNRFPGPGLQLWFLALRGSVLYDIKLPSQFRAPGLNRKPTSLPLVTRLRNNNSTIIEVTHGHQP